MRVAVRCSVLQCVAVCRSVLQCVAVCCSVLQCVAVYVSHDLHVCMCACACVPRQSSYCASKYLYARNFFKHEYVCRICVTACHVKS